jgi:hypothetical protein
MPVGGGGGGGGGQPTVPPFGGSEAVVIDQLNTWAAAVVTQLAELSTGLASANGRALLLQQDVEVKHDETRGSLRQVMTAGANALNTTIDEFKIELGKHEFAHNLARTQIEEVVAGAGRMFQENNQIAARDAQTLYDGFVAECARRDIEDAKLRADLQNKFTEVEGMLTQMAAGGAASSATDPLQQRDAWASALAARAAAQPLQPWELARDAERVQAAAATARQAPTGQPRRWGHRPRARRRRPPTHGPRRA